MEIDEKDQEPSESRTMTGVLSTLSEREQKAAYMRAAGIGSKEIAAEIGLSDNHVRHMFAQNGPHRNEKLLAAVREIREGLAEKLKGIESLIDTRLRQEIQHGDPEFAHKYIALARDFVKDMDEREKSGSEGGPRIAALIQNVFKT